MPKYVLALDFFVLDADIQYDSLATSLF